MKFGQIAAVAVLAAAGACTTATVYGPATRPGGYGFSEQAIENDRYRITFRGNSLTTREQVENALLLRAGEVTLQRGYDYFVITEGDTESTSSFTTTSNFGAFGPRFGYGAYGFPYYPYGWGWGPSAFAGYDATTRERKRYSAVAYVNMFKGPKPEGDVAAYDARQVVDNLRPVVAGQGRR